MNQPQQVGRNNDSSQINSNKTSQVKPIKLSHFDNIIYKVSLLFIGQLIISLALGKMIYCGIEGTCDAPMGYTFLFLTSWIFIDLLILLIYALKYKIGTKGKLVLVVLVLISPALIYFSYFQIKKDDENLRLQRETYEKKSAEDYQKYVQEEVIPEQQKNAACETEYTNQKNAHSLISSSDRLSTQDDYQVYDYTFGFSTAKNTIGNWSSYTKAKLFVPKEFNLFLQPPKECPDAKYVLGFWDNIHNLYIEEEDIGRSIKLYNQYTTIYDLIDTNKYPATLAQFEKKDTDNMTIYYSKQLQAPYFIIVSMPWNTEQNDWTNNKRFIYEIVNGDIDQNLVNKLLQSVEKISLE